MWITRLKLVDFRRFERLELEFAPGINLVLGENESGKSTVIAAILACLFESPSAANAVVRSSYRWGAGKAPALEMEFADGERRYRLAKDFGARTVVLEELGGGLRLDTRKAVESAVGELAGFAGADGYARTACVTQGQMAGLASDAAGARKLAAMLREVVIGSGESGLVDRAHVELARSVEELGKGLDRPARNPGIIKRLSGEREALSLRLDSAAGFVADMERNRERLADIERELARKTPELEEKRSLLGKNLGLVELEKRRERAAGDFERARTVELVRDELMRGSEAPAAARGRAVRPWPGWAIASVGVLVAVLAAYLGTIHTALLALLVPGIVLIAAGAYLVGTPERRGARVRVDSLAGDGRTAGVVEARRQASLEVAGIDARLDELEPFRLEPVGLESLERELGGLEVEVEGLNRERDALAFHISRAPVDPEEVLALEEELEWVAGEEERERRRLRVFSIALEAMGEAREALLSSAVPALEASLGRTLSTLTRGRYDTVNVRESDLGISVFSAEKGEVIQADELLSTLSAGTAAQLYLAARLGLVELLAGGKKPPLIFDDSFSRFDDARLGRLWEMLLDLSGEQQVLLFTCTSRYDALSRAPVNVIDLAPFTAGF